MSLTTFFESQVSLKASKKHIEIGSKVRASQAYLKQLFSLLYKGYDVYDQITFDGKGNGVVKFAALPKTLKSELGDKLEPVFREIKFQYIHSRLGGEISFNQEAQPKTIVTAKDLIADEPEEEEEEEENDILKDLDI